MSNVLLVDSRTFSFRYLCKTLSRNSMLTTEHVEFVLHLVRCTTLTVSTNQVIINIQNIWSTQSIPIVYSIYSHGKTKT